jgi:hypothetical protein
VKDEQGRLRHALELSGPDFEPMVFAVDRETHLVAEQTYLAGGPGQPVIEEEFSDYMRVDGVQVAWTAIVRRASETVLERKIVDIKLNTPIDPALFKRPS